MSRVRFEPGTYVYTGARRAWLAGPSTAPCARRSTPALAHRLSAGRQGGTRDACRVGLDESGRRVPRELHDGHRWNAGAAVLALRTAAAAVQVTYGGWKAEAGLPVDHGRPGVAVRAADQRQVGGSFRRVLVLMDGALLVPPDLGPAAAVETDAPLPPAVLSVTQCYWASYLHGAAGRGYSND